MKKWILAWVVLAVPLTASDTFQGRYDDVKAIQHATKQAIQDSLDLDLQDSETMFLNRWERQFLKEEDFRKEFVRYHRPSDLHLYRVIRVCNDILLSEALLSEYGKRKDDPQMDDEQKFIMDRIEEMTRLMDEARRLRY